MLVDEFQQTIIPDVYCAGEATGIGGLELSLVEGQIAGLAATDQREKARAMFGERRKLQLFADLLNRTFALREELWQGVMPAITICFKEDLSIDHEFVARHVSWLVDHGCTGIITPGSLGEGNTLTFEENRARMSAA